MIIIVDGAKKHAIDAEILLVTLVRALPDEPQRQVIEETLKQMASGAYTFPFLERSRIVRPEGNGVVER